MNGYIYLVLSKVKPVVIAGAAEILLHYITAITIPKAQKNAIKEYTAEKQIAETAEKIYTTMLEQGKTITAKEVYKAARDAYYNPSPELKISPELMEKYKELFGDQDQKKTNEERVNEKK